MSEVVKHAFRDLLKKTPMKSKLESKSTSQIERHIITRHTHSLEAVVSLKSSHTAPTPGSVRNYMDISLTADFDNFRKKCVSGSFVSILNHPDNLHNSGRSLLPHHLNEANQFVFKIGADELAT